MSVLSSSRAARLLSALVPVATAGTTLQAQVARTGGTSTLCGGMPCDANWSVTWYGISALTAGVTGSQANATIVTSIPSPPWSANITGVQQWIGVAAAANVGTTRTGNNENNYRYFFQTTFTPQQASTLNFGIAWDNKLVGAYVGTVGIDAKGNHTTAGATWLLPGTTPSTPYAGGKSGVCRDGDGLLPSATFPDCTLDVSLGVPAAEARTLTFIIQGDGSTDGFLAGAGTASTVPEPSTYALMGTGLAAPVGVVRRRKQQG